MKRIMSFILALPLLAGCGASSVDTNLIPNADQTQISRVEPPCWWVGMNTKLQLLVQGPDISLCKPALSGGKGVKIAKVTKAESPNYLFIDVDIAPDAKAGEYYLLFTAPDGSSFKYRYELGERRKGSAQRKSYGTADAIYLLMPDRFCNMDKSNDHTEDTADKTGNESFFGRYGGDIAGIESKLDYIADLGMTAIWCTPLLLDNEPVASYHGYACADYYKIDPRLGSNESYKALVAKMHEKGLKMIMDCVPNHCGGAHWWMQDLPFKDWVHQWPSYQQSNCAFSIHTDPYVSKKDKAEMEGGWFDTSMPDMNLDNPFVLQYFKQWAVWWIEYADLDGLRVDTFPYNEKYPISAWCKSVREEYPNINIVGEVWSMNVPQVAYWQAGNPNKDGFDSHLPSIMDFCLQDAMCKAFNEDARVWDGGMMRIYNSMANDAYFHDVDNMMVFPGNHDTEHIADMLGAHEGKWRCVMALMSTVRGYPQIFSGDELMQQSADLKWGHGGLRQLLPEAWDKDEKMARCHDYFKALFNYRKGSEAIQKGNTLHFLSRDNVYAYFRYTEKDVVFTFINNNPYSYTVPWADYSEFSLSLSSMGTDIVSGESIEMDKAVVPAYSPLVVSLKYND